MDIKELMPEGVGDEDGFDDSDSEEIVEAKVEKIGQNQVYGIITDRKPEWQSIIYELINSEQLDPWDIDIVVLTSKYFEKVFEKEEHDFYISSKVLFAASLLLRIKSEFLLNKYIRSIDEVLFGDKSEKKEIEKIEIDFEELPVLTPNTPMARLKKITLPELMSALNKAMVTESRRIRKEVAVRRAHKLSHVDIPQFRRIDLKDRIREFYARILTSMKSRKGEEKHLNKIGYLDLVGKEKEQKLSCFLPLLHLSNTQKLWLEQEGHLDEIWVYLYKYFDKNRDKFIEELEEDIEEMKEELGVDGGSGAGLDSGVGEVRRSGLEKAREKMEAKKKMEEAVKKELMEELGKEIVELDKDKRIEEVSGFSDEG